MCLPSSLMLKFCKSYVELIKIVCTQCIEKKDVQINFQNNSFLLNFVLPFLIVYALQREIK